MRDDTGTEINCKGEIVRRDEKGRLMPGTVLNPNLAGRLPKAKSFTRKDVLAICEEMGFNPVRELISLAQNTQSDYVKFQCCEAVLSYSLPKLKTVQLTGADGETDASITFRWENVDKPPADAVAATSEMSNAAGVILDGVVDAIIEDD